MLKEHYKDLVELGKLAATQDPRASADGVPYLSPQLLAWLDRLFPERSARLGETHDSLMFKGGQRSVVMRLREEYDKQQQR